MNMYLWCIIDTDPPQNIQLEMIGGAQFDTGKLHTDSLLVK